MRAWPEIDCLVFYGSPQALEIRRSVSTQLEAILNTLDPQYPRMFPRCLVGSSIRWGFLWCRFEDRCDHCELLSG
jgi:hypothetical protein